MSRILAAREALDREIRADINGADSAQLESLRLRVAEQARQLSKLANDFYQRHPTNASRFQAEQQAIYSTTLLGMVSRKDTSRVWSMSEGINSCLSKSWVIDTYSVSPERASEMHSLVETAAADAVIAALPLRPENYIGAVRLAERSGPAVGRRLSQALVDSPFLRDSLRSAASGFLKRRISIGQPPVLKFIALDGSHVDLVTLRGKVVLLDFWATDCPPCIEQFTELKELFERYKELGLEIIGISSDKDPKRPERVLRQKGIPWPNFASTEGLSNEHCVAFGVSGIPDIFLIDRNGILREAGAIQNLENKVKYLLKTSDTP